MAKFILHNFLKIANDFVPETFGRLTTIGPRFRLRDEKGRIRYYQVFECSCGEVLVSRARVNTKCGDSCGCSQVEAVTKHGLNGTPEHRAWQNAKERCNNPTHQCYKNYGGRGINMCERWGDNGPVGFSYFLADLGPRPSPKHSLERKDVNGPYSPENCIWGTLEEQNNNRRDTVYLEYNGERLPFAILAKMADIHPDTLRSRLERGWPVEKAMTTPLRVVNQHKKTTRTGPQ